MPSHTWPFSLSTRKSRKFPKKSRIALAAKRFATYARRPPDSLRPPSNILRTVPAHFILTRSGQFAKFPPRRILRRRAEDVCSAFQKNLTPSLALAPRIGAFRQAKECRGREKTRHQCRDVCAVRRPRSVGRGAWRRCRGPVHR